jgi:hypothetical protein
LVQARKINKTGPARDESPALKQRPGDGEALQATQQLGKKWQSLMFDRRPESPLTECPITSTSG